MNQIERVREMEERFDRISLSVQNLKGALKSFAALSNDISALETYYTVGAWTADFEDDERGLLPKDLKRGVLSEDGVYNLLEEITALKRALKKL